MPKNPIFFLNKWILVRSKASNIPKIILKNGKWKMTLRIWNFSSIFLLSWSKARYILKICLLACLVPEITIKKTSKLLNGRGPHKFSLFSSLFLVVRLKVSYVLKISLKACLVPETSMKKTTKLVNGRQPHKILNIFFSISPS